MTFPPRGHPFAEKPPVSFGPESRKGGTFVSMPSFKTKTVDEEGNAIYKDIAFPVTKEFRGELFAKIKESYESGEVVEFEW